MLLVAVLLVQGLFVVGWFPALRVPGAAGGQVVVGAVAVAADIAVLVADETRPLEHVASVLAWPCWPRWPTSWSGGTAGSS